MWEAYYSTATSADSTVLQREVFKWGSLFPLMHFYLKPRIRRDGTRGLVRQLR
jgi:hypothetical protein